MIEEKEQQESKPGATTGWGKLPPEVIGNAMGYLSSVDLKSCRLVDESTGGEATRVLFETLYQVATPDSRDRASKIMGAANLARYIRGLDYQGPTFYQFSSLQNLLDSVYTKELKILSLSNISANDAWSLFSNNKNADLLSNVRNFSLTFRVGITFSQRWDPRILEGCANLAAQLPLVEELTVGFGGDRFPLNTPLQFIKQREISQQFLNGTYPRVRTVSLENLIATDGEILTFLKRQNKTLRSLTLKSIYLEWQEEYERTAGGTFRGGLSNIVRFILLLHKHCQLEQMTLSKKIMTPFKRDGEDFWCRGCEIKLREVGQTFRDLHRGLETRSATGSLRHMVEDFICHRGELPFRSLRPYMTELAERSVSSSAREIYFGGDMSPLITIRPEDDDTFELVLGK